VEVLFKLRQILILLMLICFSLGAGCTVARKPEPAPEQKPSVIPETSKVGFSPVDLNKAPDVIKNIASDISKREAATWAQVNGTNYVLISVGDSNTGNKAEVTEVIQKVPAQDFIWIEVRGKYTSVKEGAKSGPVTAVSLSLQNKTINGVGFELLKAAVSGTTQTTPVPAPAPAAPTPTPAAPAPKTAPTPAPTTERKTTPEPAKKEQPPATETERGTQQ